MNNNKMDILIKKLAVEKKIQDDLKKKRESEKQFFLLLNKSKKNNDETEDPMTKKMNAIRKKLTDKIQGKNFVPIVPKPVINKSIKSSKTLVKSPVINKSSKTHISSKSRKMSLKYINN